QLCQPVRLMGGRPPLGAHFVEQHWNPAPRHLPGGLGTRQSASDNVYRFCHFPLSVAGCAGLLKLHPVRNFAPKLRTCFRHLNASKIKRSPTAFFESVKQKRFGEPISPTFLCISRIIRQSWLW